MASQRNGQTVAIGEKVAGESGGASVHLSLQGKGGVGKSLVASLLAQYFRHRKAMAVRCIDTDPVNQTLSQYKELAAERLELLREGSVDQRAFDGLMESLLTQTGTFIVDNGASTFIPLWNYMLENNAMGLLKENGRRVYVHCVITGGQALADTLSGFARLSAEVASFWAISKIPSNTLMCTSVMSVLSGEASETNLSIAAPS